ncbi:hypothetical protein Hanom_Chr17g01566101 [Helianthus anomalus]
MSRNFCCNMTDSDMSCWFSWRTSFPWRFTARKRFIRARFSVLSRFNWLLMSSKCFCFLIRERLADSRLDILRLRLRSSITLTTSLEGLGKGVELSELEMENTGSCSEKRTGVSCGSQGVKPLVSRNPVSSGKRWLPAAKTSDNILPEKRLI